MTPCRLVTTLSLAVSSFLAANADAAVWSVPSFLTPTIQSAINFAAVGDTVQIFPGVYVEDIDFLGKDIVVTGLAGAANTFIVGTGAPKSVVTIRGGQTRQAVLEGFTITGSEGTVDPANPYNVPYGIGLYVHSSSPTIRHCVFDSNVNWGPGVGFVYPEGYGGAIGALYGSPEISWCTFTKNRAMLGGAVYIRDCPDAVVADCTFEKNSSWERGGAIMTYDSGVSINYCIFFKNTAQPWTTNGWANFGGALALHHNVLGASVFNCLFVGNLAGTGGAIFHQGNADSPITNCTFHANDATTAGGTIWGGSPAAPRMTNCIVWNGGPGMVTRLEGQFGGPDVTYSSIEGGYPGVGNIGVNPGFANPSALDFHLQWGSKCIDAGNSTVDHHWLPGVQPLLPWDLDGGTRVVDEPTMPDVGLGSPVVDMGVYEYRKK